MALRVALNKAKPLLWGCGNQLVRGNFGFLSAISHSPVIGLNSGLSPPTSFSQSCRRHYFLPSPPPVHIAQDPSHQFGIVSIPNDDKGALSAADFATTIANEDNQHQQNVRFERLVRASAMRFAGSIYYLTLEGTDERGDLNIYYAVVVVFPSIGMKKLIRWQLVYESFSYPFKETRCSEPLEKGHQRDNEANNRLMRAWLMGMALQSKDDRTFVEYFDFGENSSGLINFCPPWEPKKNMDPLSTVASDTVVPVEVKDNEKIYEYLSSAAEIYSKSKGRGHKLGLEEVLCASKSVVDSGVFYYLLFKAEDRRYFTCSALEDGGLDIFCGIIKVLESKVELIMLQNINELFPMCG